MLLTLERFASFRGTHAFPRCPKVPGGGGFSFERVKMAGVDYDPSIIENIALEESDTKNYYVECMAFLE